MWELYGYKVVYLCIRLKLKIMEDNRTELQKKFEEQTPTIKGKNIRPLEYLRTYCAWLELQVEKSNNE